MTNEDFERLKQSFRAQMEESSPTRMLMEETAESRKLNRDMDRLERVLKKVVSAPREKSRRDQRRLESEKAYEQRRAEIREIGSRSDAKLKALMEKLQIAKDKPPKSESPQS